MNSFLWSDSSDKILNIVQTVPTEINIGIKFQFYKSPTKIIIQKKIQITLQ